MKSSGYTTREIFSFSMISIRVSVRSICDRTSSPISVISHFHDSLREKNNNASTTDESSVIIFLAFVIPCSRCSVWSATSSEDSMEKSLFLISCAMSSENCSSLLASDFTREKSDSRDRASTTTSSRICHFTLMAWIFHFSSRENPLATSPIWRMGRSIYHENP